MPAFVIVIALGADGFYYSKSSNHADFRMRYFNADGGEAEMCEMAPAASPVLQTKCRQEGKTFI